jgi:nucleoside-diphosphate-sugar epimerase
MIILTGRGSLADALQAAGPVEVASRWELEEQPWRNHLAKATVIIHNASTIACTSLSQAVTDNFTFTQHLTDTLLEVNPTAHLIYISSMSMLDPTAPEQYASVEDMDAYAYSKYLAETYVRKSPLAHVSCVRFSTLFYRDPAKDGLSRLISDAATTGTITLINKGEATRDFLPLPIAAQYIHKMCAVKEPNRALYTLASGTETSFGAVAAILSRLMPTLTVGNKELPAGKPVLARFPMASMEQLGVIPFSLEEEIAAYYATLPHS